MRDFLTLFLGLLPAILWLVFFSPLLRKRSHLHIRAVSEFFFLGMAITIPAVVVELAFESFFQIDATSVIFLVLSATLIIAPIEEIFKFLLFKILSRDHAHIQRLHDFLAAGIIFGLGFATVENILLALQDASLTVLILRSITATLLHATTAGILGFYFALSKKQNNKRSLVWQGLLVAVLIHGVYNLLVTLPSSFGLALVVLFMLMTGFFLLLASSELVRQETH